MAYPVLFGADWLTRLRHAAGLIEVPRWQDVPSVVIAEPEWYAGYCRMTDALLDPHRDLLDKQSEVVEYLSAPMHQPGGPAGQAAAAGSGHSTRVGRLPG